MIDRDKGGIFQPFPLERFQFNCHKDIACFNQCCADLKLVLPPYDILRLKSRLGMPSNEFLDLYTQTSFDMHYRFPMVYLKMREDTRRTCPFVTRVGCSLYEDRPSACRIYPVGRACTKPGDNREVAEHYFLVTEQHCLGFEENKQWTLGAWMEHEGIKEYNVINDQWLDIISSHKTLGEGTVVPQKIQMFFMASYNIDTFKNFIFGSRFFDRFEIDSDRKELIAADEKELLLFAFEWLKFSLFGEKTMTIRQ